MLDWDSLYKNSFFHDGKPTRWSGRIISSAGTTPDGMSLVVVEVREIDLLEVSPHRKIVNEVIVRGFRLYTTEAEWHEDRDFVMNWQMGK